MSTRWIIVFFIWAVPIASMLACPYDLHGASTCSAASQIGQKISFYLASPGLALGSFLSSVVQDDPHGGESFAAYVVGAAAWLLLLSLMVLFIPGRLQRLSRRR